MLDNRRIWSRVLLDPDLYVYDICLMYDTSLNNANSKLINTVVFGSFSAPYPGKSESRQFGYSGFQYGSRLRFFKKPKIENSYYYRCKLNSFFSHKLQFCKPEPEYP
jgi:hypothetical protein